MNVMFGTLAVAMDVVCVTFVVAMVLLFVTFAVAMDVMFASAVAPLTCSVAKWVSLRVNRWLPFSSQVRLHL